MKLLKIFSSAIKANSIEAVGTIIDKVFPIEEEKQKAQTVIDKLKQHPKELQFLLNLLHDKGRSIYLAGWRPFIGWTCGLGLANVFVINPWLQWLVGIDGPRMPLDVIVELIVTMLGLGLMRTAEKLGGKTK
ncbi:MAG TPA: 3TM-type holin [Gammaproteobacteria bacterium]|nr:3TM-type holin [Gammaproteobacteria bacterium]